MDMAEFAKAKEPFLRSFLRLGNGVPSHDTFSRLFRLLNPEKFGAAFQRFMAAFSQHCQGGKVLRRSAGDLSHHQGRWWRLLLHHEGQSTRAQGRHSPGLRARSPPQRYGRRRLIFDARRRSRKVTAGSRPPSGDDRLSGRAPGPFLVWPRAGMPHHPTAHRARQGSTETVYAITSLTAEKAGPEQLLAISRRHWGSKIVCIACATSHAVKTRDEPTPPMLLRCLPPCETPR
jgi:DDE_Tnp_1-associated